MAATNNLIAYGSVVSPTITGVASLASDTNLLAGYETSSIDNSSTKAKDYLVSGKFLTGTSPTTARVIELWAIAKKQLASPGWPDVFDGTASAETATSRDILAGCGKLLWAVTTDNTSDRGYEFSNLSVAAAFGGVCPTEFTFFFTHNTGVNSKSSGHELAAQPVYDTAGN